MLMRVCLVISFVVSRRLGNLDIASLSVTSEFKKMCCRLFLVTLETCRRVHLYAMIEYIVHILLAPCRAVVKVSLDYLLYQGMS